MLAFLEYVPCARYYANNKFMEYFLMSLHHPYEVVPVICL